MFGRLTLVAAFALAVLGTGSTAAQESCRLGDPGCNPPGASIEIKEESFQPQRTVLEGDPIEMLVAIKCEGAETMAPADLNFRVVPAKWLPGTFDGSDDHWKMLMQRGQRIGTFEVPDLQCRFWRQVRFTTATVGEYAGRYYVSACLDTPVLNDPRGRCVAPVEVTVEPRPRPDLAMSMSIDKDLVRSGETILLTITARNVGQAQAAEAFIDVLWSRDRLWDGRGDHRIALLEVRELAEGETYRTTLEHPIDAGRGEIFFHACATGVMGPDKKAEERALVNNCSETLALSIR